MHNLKNKKKIVLVFIQTKLGGIFLFLIRFGNRETDIFLIE